MKRSSVTLLLALSLLCVQAVPAREVSRTGGLNQEVYEKMVEIQTLIDEGDVSRARRKLERLQGEKLSDYELAQTWFLMGYIHYRNEDYPAAIAAYRKVLVTKKLPQGLKQNVVKTLAQLSVAVADYSAALTYLDSLIKLREEPQPDDHALRAQVLYLLEDIDGALASLDKALRLQRKRGEPPRENWLQLKSALLYQRNDYSGMLTVTNQLIALYPRDRYLLSKAAIHGEMGDTRAQLALMEPLYERGSLDSAGHKVNLASLYLLHGIPYKAGVLLDAEIKADRIEATEQHLEMLAQAWLMSADTERAIKPMQQAARMGKDGNGYVTLARTYISLSRWPDAETSLEKALDKGGLKDTGGAQLMLGMVQFNQKNFRDARRSFARAGQDPNTEKLSRQWLQHLEREEEKARLAEQASG
jgi:tetratricopeptide (TPR) repeat protein